MVGNTGFAARDAGGPTGPSNSFRNDPRIPTKETRNEPMSDVLSLEEATAKVRENAGAAKPLGATLKFLLLEDLKKPVEDQKSDVIFLDGTGDANVVTNDDGDAKCTVKISDANFSALLAGKGNPMAMFMGGKIKIEGDMGVAMKLQSVLK